MNDVYTRANVFLTSLLSLLIIQIILNSRVYATSCSKWILRVQNILSSFRLLRSSTYYWHFDLRGNEKHKINNEDRKYIPRV